MPTTKSNTGICVVTHGHCVGNTTTRAYRIWAGMLTRCTNPNSRNYPDYGARGIQVCEHWKSFENFYADMGDPPDGFTIDRIDNDGNYCKANCAWQTPLKQARNRRSNVLLTLNGLTLPLIEWAERLGVPYKSLSSRYRMKWSHERMLTEPFRKDLRRCS